MFRHRMFPLFGILSVLVSAAGCGGEVATAERHDEQAPSPVGAGPSGEPRSDTATRSDNDRCASPARLNLTGGRAVVVEDTSAVADEFSGLDCNSRGTAGTLSGPQKYFVLHVQGGKTYRFALTPSFHAVLVGFEAAVGCTEAAIQDACRGNDARGFASGLINPGTGTPGATAFSVAPPYHADRDKDLVLVIDSDGGSGSFELSIVEE